MKEILTFLLTFSSLTILCSQGINIDCIDFDDETKYDKKIVRNSKNKVDYIEYAAKEGLLKRKDFYFRGLPNKTKIWKSDLIHDIRYKFIEKRQVIKRYDRINKQKLPTLLNVTFYSIKYPIKALENEIEGIVKVSFSLDENCIPESYQILNHLGYGIDEEVIKYAKKVIKYSQEYKIARRGCDDFMYIKEINFDFE